MGSVGLPTSHHLYPPFPDDIKTAPLVSISLDKLQGGDEEESKAFFEASKGLGFFYLKLDESELGQKIVSEAEQLNDLQQAFYKRPQEEREEFAREKIDAFFGYRQVQLKVTDENGSPLRNETYNMRKDDFVGNSDPLPTHDMIKRHWDLLTSYVYHCREAIDLMITHLENHLELPTGTLANLHRIKDRSGDHVRFNKAAIQPFSDERAKAGEHTDFGTLTILMNWLGGLQIRLQDTGEWVYVKPVPGSAVVNLGDALVKFTAGILRSNIHRVAAPPPPQDGIMRTSLVYFSRPEDKVVLRRLKGGIIDQQPEVESDEPELTAQEWTWRRSVGDMKGVYTHKGGLEARENQNVGGR